MTNKTITICGSMSFFEKMSQLAIRLRSRGHQVFIPTLSTSDFSKMSKLQKIQEKKKHIFEHLEWIRQSDAVIIANWKKNNIEGYIGPNTLMEIAFATSLDKTIYFVEKPGVQYCLDEVEALGICPLEELIVSLG